MAHSHFWGGPVKKSKIHKTSKAVLTKCLPDKTSADLFFIGWSTSRSYSRICISVYPHVLMEDNALHILLAVYKTVFFLHIWSISMHGCAHNARWRALVWVRRAAQVAGKVGSLACSCSLRRHLLTLIWCCSTNLLLLDVAYYTYFHLFTLFSVVLVARWF